MAPRWGTLTVKSGDISVDAGQVTAGNFVIDMNSIKVDPASVTEKDKKPADLEGHLKSPDFFDVAKNPTSDFKITSVTDLKEAPKDAIAGANKTVSGNLTLSGKTMNVTFPAKVDVAEGTAAVQAKFTVNRADWGIKFGTSEADPAEWMISKDIEIAIDVKAKNNFKTNQQSVSCFLWEAAFLIWRLLLQVGEGVKVAYHSFKRFLKNHIEKRPSTKDSS